MSPIALKLLTFAYENYLKTGSLYCSYSSPNSNDFIYTIEAIRQLYYDEYIDEVSPQFLSRIIPATSLFIDFNITEKGIEFMNSYRKHK